MLFHLSLRIHPPAGFACDLLGPAPDPVALADLTEPPLMRATNAPFDGNVSTLLLLELGGDGIAKVFPGSRLKLWSISILEDFFLIGEYDSSDDVGHVGKIDSRILVMWSCDVACCRTEIWMRFRTTCVVPLPLKMAPCRAPWVTRPVNTRAPGKWETSEQLGQTMLADMGPVWPCRTDI